MGIRWVNVRKYRMLVIKLGYFKIEWCKFKSKFMLRFEINNWDK